MPRLRLLLDFLRPRRSYAYGREHNCQRAELWLPAGDGPHPVLVTIHGGSWRAGYTKFVMRGLAGDLVRRGFAVWNIEYRCVGRGQGGGWPATFADVASAIDALAGLKAPVDIDAVTVLGHSAGAALALWAGSRASLPAGAPGANPLVSPIAIVAQAAPADLAGIYRATGGGAVASLMGGSPERFADRYALADPLARVPLPMPTLLVHGTDDRVVSALHSRNYARAARAAGGAGAGVGLVELDRDASTRHRSHLDPASPAWAVVVRWLALRNAALNSRQAAPGLPGCPTC
jgi:acetyl esterase/lipase